MPGLTIPLFKVLTSSSVLAALKPVLESGQLAAGKQVLQFESRLAAWLGATDAVTLSDASAALTLALYQAGVRPGDEVISSPLACSATLSPIANLFALPRWCDINPDTGMPDAEHIEASITEKTRAILLYHWSGNVGNVSAIKLLAHQYDLKLIEDASEAWGAEQNAHRLGGKADFTIYSFYATKHLNTGEGAVLLTSNPERLLQARHLRRLGIDSAQFRLANGDLNPEFNIPLAGFNFPMNEIAATLGLEHLTTTDQIVKRHRSNGEYYEDALSNIPGVRLLHRNPNSISGYWTYSLRAERRCDLVKKLHSWGIGAQRLHLRNDNFSCFEKDKRILPGVTIFDAENLSIPCGWWIGEAEREAVVECIKTGW